MDPIYTLCRIVVHIGRSVSMCLVSYASIGLGRFLVRRVQARVPHLWLRENLALSGFAKSNLTPSNSKVVSSNLPSSSPSFLCVVRIPSFREGSSLHRLVTPVLSRLVASYLSLTQHFSLQVFVLDGLWQLGGFRRCVGFVFRHGHRHACLFFGCMRHGCTHVGSRIARALLSFPWMRSTRMRLVRLVRQWMRFLSGPGKSVDPPFSPSPSLQSNPHHSPSILALPRV
eukprot:scaffold541_cov335-Pavlova_lutheri.AAC.27